MKPGIALFVGGDAMGLNEIMLAREECKNWASNFGLLMSQSKRETFSNIRQ